MTPNADLEHPKNVDSCSFIKYDMSWELNEILDLLYCLQTSYCWGW